MAEHGPVKIKCLVVDDEPLAREVLKRYIEEIPTLELVGECASVVQTIISLQQQATDLIFLDIRMPQLNGTDLLKTVKNLPKVIFTTAYSEYALEGYELDVVDYLMKPVRFDRFLKAVNKAYPLQTGKPLPETETAQEEKKPEPFAYFRVDRKMIKVLFNDILYIESMKDYVKVITTANTIITKQSISSVEAMLPEKLFVRTHRSFIASVDKIKSFTPEILEIGKNEIPIGKLYRNTVLKMLS
jgi:DNA-binding LytR/AlgR family response regulator